MLRRTRIVTQLGVLVLFLYLFARTIGTGEDGLGPPVRVFLEIDPLLGLTTWLATGALPGLMALSFITLAAAFVLGRSFCGWVCPLGTLGQISGRLLRRRRDERVADRARGDQQIKVLVLFFVAAGSLAGAFWTGLLDPLSLLIRSLTAGFVPAGEAVLRGAAASLARTPLAAVSEPLYQWLRERVLLPRPPAFEQGALIAALFLVLLGLSWVRRRFWCRVLCPLGALLGLTAHAGMLRLRQDASRCTECSLCTYHCQGAADPDIMGGWKASECFVCGNCTASCARNGLAFTFEAPRVLTVLGRREREARRKEAATRRGPRHAAESLARRRVLLALGLGFVAGGVVRSTPSRAHPGDTLVRPPGAGPEGEFLDRCVRCGECMKVCPANGLHPAGLDDGILSLWTPVLRPRIGYCEYHCTLCGQVCPTQAIHRLSPEEKTRTVIGLAYVDTTRCLPYAYATPCIVCEEHCPTSPKAIVLVDTTVHGRDGAARQVRQPRVDPRACVGCGICETKCPIEGNAAIRIFATGRTGEGGPFDLN